MGFLAERSTTPRRRLLRWAVLLFAVFAGCACLMFKARQQSILRCIDSSDDPRALKVLFIGNSYTSVNDLPMMFAELCKSDRRRRHLKIYEAAVGGFTLEEHWQNGQVRDVINDDGPWDFIILQEHSRRPITEPQMMREFARLFDAEIKRSAAQTVFYQTWARLSEADNQPIINDAYQTIAGELDATLAPVGSAFAASDGFRSRFYQQDESHPTPLGTYLAACVFFATLQNKSPEGLPYRDIIKASPWTDMPPAEVRQLQRLAWEVVQKQRAAAGNAE